MGKPGDDWQRVPPRFSSDIGDDCPESSETFQEPCTIKNDDQDKTTFVKTAKTVEAAQAGWSHKSLAGGTIRNMAHESVLHNTVGIDERFAKYTAGDLEGACDIAGIDGGHN